MKIVYHMALPALVAILSISSARAALMESVESAAARPALQRADAFLCEQVVGAQLIKLGVTPEQAQLRLASLNDVQLAQLAVQVDKLQAGGDIQGGNPHPFGPIGCFFKCIGDTFVHLFKTLFCWTDCP